MQAGGPCSSAPAMPSCSVLGAPYRREPLVVTSSPVSSPVARSGHSARVWLSVGSGWPKGPAISYCICIWGRKAGCA
jgi:hypothetical protein